MRRALIVILVLILDGPMAWGNSAYLFLFASSKERAELGVKRQRARRVLALREYGRAIRESATGAIAPEQFDVYRAAAKVSDYDLEIAQLKAKEAVISYRLALAVASHGGRVPICQRIKQIDPDSVTPLLKKKDPPYRPSPVFDDQGSGTRIIISGPIVALSAPDSDPPVPAPFSEASGFGSPIPSESNILGPTGDPPLASGFPSTGISVPKTLINIATKAPPAAVAGSGSKTPPASTAGRVAKTPPAVVTGSGSTPSSSSTPPSTTQPVVPALGAPRGS